MFLIIPHEIDTLQQVRPWANWLILACISVVSLFALIGGGLEAGSLDFLLLNGFSFPGLLGHVLLHGDLGHLVGNLIFLWVFGNAICTNIGNFRYLTVFLFCTLIAALTHILLDGRPALGASGAINGVVGVTLAMYPLNGLHFFWFIMMRGGTFSWPAWSAIVIWLLLDLWGALGDGQGVAYWAHIGGLIGGVAIGIAGLHKGWITLTIYDNRSLLDLIRGVNEAK